MPGKSAASRSKVFVDKNDVLDELIESAMRESSVFSKATSMNTKAASYGGDTVYHDSAAAKEKKKAMLLEQYQQKSQKIEAITKQNIKKTIQIESERKDRNFKSMLSEIESAKELLKTVDYSLKLQDEANHNKVRRQFEDWNTTVHGRIQGDITSQVNSIDYKELNRIRNENFQKFLDITNRKPAIFRDIIIESEYDPLEPNRHTVKALTGKLRDPCRMVLQKREEEESMLSSTNGFPARSAMTHTRYTLPTEQWLTGKIEATPHGIFEKMMKENPNKPIPKANNSKVTFDDYSYKTGKEVMDKEMPRGKKVYPNNAVSDVGMILDTAMIYDEGKPRGRKPVELARGTSMGRLLSDGPKTR